ncbi:MAG: 30S ribosome-binding factor RbfA [Actinomycetota bacterium]|nr:30S ribosome-binding factor RbfA [Actinomycetota bacterium]
MPKNYPRSERVEQLAKEVLGEAIQELKDPRIGFATITSVKVSPDLRQARVYVSALGSEDERVATLEGIQHAAPHLRKVLGTQMRLKHLPYLDIIEDETAEAGERIEQLLRGLGVSKPPEVEPLQEPGT